MLIRKPFLPAGWYPRDPAGVGEFLAPFGALRAGAEGRAAAALAPHAGWFYSGALAARSAASLSRGVDTVAVIGGHLPPDAPPLCAPEDGVWTPLGAAPIDGELRDAFKRRVPCGKDLSACNTVEVLVPMVRYFFPEAALLWLRFPAALSSYEAGRVLFECASSLGRRLAVLASTDLTHYGPRYGFTPAGLGRKALDWARDVNDQGFLEALLAGDAPLLLERALRDSSACSPGAALGALGFARAAGAHKGALLARASSADAEEGSAPDSFVDYASVAWFAD